MDIIFRTLQDFFSSLGLPLEQDFEMTIHELKGLHGEGSKKSPEFRTDYFSFLLITKGQSHYTIDGNNFDLGPNSFYFTLPGHVKSFQIDVPLEGFIVTFTEHFFKQHFIGDIFSHFPFLLQESTPMMQLNDAIVKEVHNIFVTMHQIYVADSPFKKEILFHNLSILLYKTKELLQSHQLIIKSSSRSMELVNQFKLTLNDSFKKLVSGKADKLPTIKEIAFDLNVHPNYLSNVIKEESGKSATHWIQDRTSAESQALLKNTTKTISEIGFLLGFTDSTHFSKFFKKMVGISPSDFRKSLN